MSEVGGVYSLEQSREEVEDEHIVPDVQNIGGTAVGVWRR